MKLSQIFESLSPASVIRTEITNDAIRIRQVCKLSMASSSFADDTLYISLLSNYTALRCYGSDSLFLLIKDQEDLSQVIWPSNYILCTSDIAEADLYVRLIKLQSTSNRVTDAKITLSHALSTVPPSQSSLKSLLICLGTRSCSRILRHECWHIPLLIPCAWTTRF